MRVLFLSLVLGGCAAGGVIESGKPAEERVCVDVYIYENETGCYWINDCTKICPQDYKK